MIRFYVLPVMLIALVGCAVERSQSVVDPGFLEQYARTDRFSLGLPRAIKVVHDGSAVLFLRSGGDSNVQDLYEFDVATASERVLLTAERLLAGADEFLSVEERARRERLRLSTRGIGSYELSRDGKRVLVPISGRLFVMDREDRRLTELKSDLGYPIDPQFSPDASKIACVRNGDLYVTNIAEAIERRLTRRSDDDVTNGTAEFVAQEEMDRHRGYWWSPDGERIAYQRTDVSDVEVMHIMDATHPEAAPQSWAYPRPGKPNADVQLGIIELSSEETAWVQWDRMRYPYLATVRWEEHAPLTILVQNRAQTEERLLSVDDRTGATSELLVERDGAWLNLDQSMPKWSGDRARYLWMTERNGAWQLESRDRNGGIKPLTSPDFSLSGFAHIDETRREIYVIGGDDPTQSHLYRLSGPDGAPQRLTNEPGVHAAVFAEHAPVYVLTSETMDGRLEYEVRHADGRSLGRLTSVAVNPPFVPRIELTTVGDDPVFHAVIVRPRDFVGGRKYPVIVSVYGGPHSQTVRAAPRRYLLQQWMADHGFIVVSIDGRGTPSRGRDWERAIKGNLIDVPLADQVSGLRALGARYPELDMNRVGIYGWSFGGYFSAMAAMRRPDVFHAAVAGAPVADWMDYDTHYTERYLGLPEENAAGYAASSVLTYAGDLRVPLLIIHGTSDDNVYFSHSLKMSDALFRAGRRHEFLPLSQFTHMVRDPLVTTRLQTGIMSFFTRHLIDDLE